MRRLLSADGWGIIFAMRRPSMKDSGVFTRAGSQLTVPLIMALSLGPTAAIAQDASWKSNPVSGDFNTGANWTPATVPDGTASFGASNTTSLTLSAATTIGAFQFNPGAPSYTFG